MDLERRAKGGLQQLLSPLKVIKESDPLFGVLTEDQVGINPLTSRPRIAEDVLQGIRHYLLVDNGDDIVIKEERVKNSLKEVEKYHMAQRTILRLEPAPIISHDVNKGKCLVFDYDTSVSASKERNSPNADPKLLSVAIKVSNAMSESRMWRLGRLGERLG